MQELYEDSDSSDVLRSHGIVQYSPHSIPKNTLIENVPEASHSAQCHLVDEDVYHDFGAVCKDMS